MAKPFKSSKYIKAANTWVGTKGRMIYLLKAKAKESKLLGEKKKFQIVRHMLPHEKPKFLNPALK